jgi:hypothetical protein
MGCILCSVSLGNRGRIVYYCHPNLSTTKKSCLRCGKVFIRSGAKVTLCQLPVMFPTFGAVEQLVFWSVEGNDAAWGNADDGRQTQTVRTSGKANADHGSAIWGGSECIEGAISEDNR